MGSGPTTSPLARTSSRSIASSAGADQAKQPILVHRPDRVEPVRGDTEIEQRVLGAVAEHRRDGFDTPVVVGDGPHRHRLLDLAEHDDLGGPGTGVDRDLPPLRPGIGVIVTTDVADRWFEPSLWTISRRSSSTRADQKRSSRQRSTR